MAGISFKAAGFLENKKKFVGQEFDDELGWNNYQFKFRTHDPQVGRFLQIDPLAHEYVYNSTYAYAENRPIDGIDLEGLEFLRTVGNIARDGSVNPGMTSTHVALYIAAKKSEYTGSVAAVDRMERGQSAKPSTPGPPHIQKAQSLVNQARDAEKALQPSLDVLETSVTLASFVPVGEAGLVGNVGSKVAASVANGVPEILTSVARESPNFIVDLGGQVFPVPKGATGPIPAVNKAGVSNGIQFIGGEGGFNGQVTTMRVMNPTAPKGKSPGYPNGYVKYENASRQGVNPYTGETGPRSEVHFPLMINPVIK